MSQPFNPPYEMTRELGASPGHISFGKHIAVISNLLAEIAVDKHALSKPALSVSETDEVGEWALEFRESIIAIQKQYSLDHSNLLHLLSTVLKELTHFIDFHCRGGHNVR